MNTRRCRIWMCSLILGLAVAACDGGGSDPVSTTDLTQTSVAVTEPPTTEPPITTTRASSTVAVEPVPVTATEFEFYAAVVACTAIRSGQDLGEMVDGRLGLASAEAYQAWAAAQGESAYDQCFLGSLPVVPDLDPITGCGDYTDAVYSEIGWFEVTALIVECANDQGAPVRLSSQGDGIDGFGSAGVHLNAWSGALVEVCRDGLNLPPYSE